MKDCGHCEKQYVADHGLQRYCSKVCRTRAKRARTPKDKLRQYKRTGDIRRAYGLSREAYASLAEGQGGVCAICQEPETMRPTHGTGVRPLSIDHDHESGVVRGLLCAKCNMAIGLMLDDPYRLMQAAIYLENANG